MSIPGINLRGLSQVILTASIASSTVCAATSTPVAAVTFGYAGSGADNIVGTSISSYTIPTTGTYTIDAFGAQGGKLGSFLGGKGGELKADFNLNAGTLLSILIGQQGNDGNSGARSGGGGGGGGGGAFVKNGSTILIAAGGGGGSSNLNDDFGGGGGGGGVSGGNGGFLSNVGGVGGVNGGNGGNSISNDGIGNLIDAGGGGGGIAASFAGGIVNSGGNGGFGGGGGGGSSSFVISGGGGGGSFGSSTFGSGGNGGRGTLFGGGSADYDGQGVTGGYDSSAIANTIASNNSIRSGNGFLSISLTSVPTAVPEPFTIVGTLIGSAAAFRMRKRLKVTNKL